MAWLFVRLKLSLIAGGLRGPGGPARIVGLVAAIAGALWVMPIGFVLLALQHGKPVAVSAAVVAFSVFAVGWLVLPLATFGADETLDPARLALLPLRPAALARGLMAAALTGIGPFVTVVILLGAVAGVASGPVPALVGLVAVAIELGLCVAGSRALVTALSGLLRSRRGRDLGVLIGGLLSLALFGTNLMIQHSLGPSVASGTSGIGSGLSATATVARWAPPGLTAHAIADASAGRYGIAGLELGTGAATVLLLVWIWIAALRRALENPDTSTQVRRAGRAGMTSAAPASAGAISPADASASPAAAGTLAASASPAAAGALAAISFASAQAGRGLPGWRRWAWASRTLNAAGRELRYYRRDPRRKQQIVSLAMPVLLILVNFRTGGRIGEPAGQVVGLSDWPAVLGGLIAGLFSSANQFGMDGSALWMNLAATTRWQDLRADIAGKNLAGAVITLPVFAVLYAVLGTVAHNGASAAEAFAMALLAFGAASGVATIVSVLLPVPVPERRSSAFSGGGAGQGCLAGLATFAGLAVAGATIVPVIAARAILHPGLWLLLAAPAYGAALAWAGRIIAARAGFRKLPEVLAQVTRPV